LFFPDRAIHGCVDAVAGRADTRCNRALSGWSAALGRSSAAGIGRPATSRDHGRRRGNRPLAGSTGADHAAAGLPAPMGASQDAL